MTTNQFIKIQLLLLVIILIPFSSFSQGGGRLTQTLSGENWAIISTAPEQGKKDGYYKNEYSFSEAIPSKVPGDIHWDLERANKIKNLYYGMNSRDAQWVTGKEWWYKKVFSVDKKWKDKTIRLHFDAVDYLAEVWLNGQYLGRHEGQFTSFEFDVTSKIQFGKDNMLKVLIHPVPEKVRQVIATEAREWDVLEAMRPAYPYWKSMTSSGWDWGADLISMGIWQDVRLIGSKDVYISDLTVLPNLPSPYNRATLNIKTNLQAYKNKKIMFTWLVKCITEKDTTKIVKQESSIVQGKQEIKIIIELQNPRLWWPNGYGKQNLYELTVSVTDAIRNITIDQTSVTFGIRDLQMLANPESPTNKKYWDYGPQHSGIFEMNDSIPQRKYLIQINGKRILGMGSNWIPADLLFGRPDYNFYGHLIRLAAQANFNLFRIWGGGLLEKQEFFDLCDRYGIMLFAEFPNGGVPLPETDEGLKITASETLQLLPLMMNHPCVIRYGGGNEWYTNAKNSRQMAQLRQICNEADPTRPFHDPDPETIAQRHAPHSYIYENHYTTYNTGYPMSSGPEDPMEWTEYGAAGASSIATLKRIMPEENLFPVKHDDPYWTWHKAQDAYGADNWLGSAQYLRLFGQLPDLETTVKCSQFVQAEGLRYATQSMRRNQWHRSAFASWTFNEPWPNAAHGCLVEYYGQPKMAYYYTQKSCAPIDVSCVYFNLECTQEKPLDVEVWVSNINSEPIPNTKLRWRIFSTKGEKYFEGNKLITIPSENSDIVGKISWRPTSESEGDVALLYVELIDSHEQVIADNLYTFGIQKSNSDTTVKNSPSPPLKALLHASPTQLKLQAIDFHESGNGNVEGIVEVENIGGNVALFVELSTDAMDDTRVYFFDNYFFLPKGEKRQIKVTIDSEKLDQTLKSVKLSAKAWNSSSQNLKILQKK